MLRVWLQKFINFFIVSRRKEIPFVIFFSFFITFVIARIVVHLIMTGALPSWLMLNINGVHVHHLTYGIFILAISGFLALIDHNRRYLYKLALFYGIGLGLAFDEFGMWIHLDDNYWMRSSYDAIIVLCAVFFNIIYFNFFWKKIGSVVLKITKQSKKNALKTENEPNKNQ